MARLPLLDAIRGMALLGVLLINLRSLSLYDFLAADERLQLPTAAFDAVLLAWMNALYDGTAFTLFTLLFGIGFSIQLNATNERADPQRVSRYVRRLLILLGIGLLHGLIWWGDILRYYAVLGLLLIPLRRWSARSLTLLGLAVILVSPMLLRAWLVPLLPPTMDSRTLAQLAAEAFASTDPATWLSGNLERDLYMRIAVWMLPTYVFGRLILGLALGRTGALLNPRQHLRLWRRLCWMGAVGAAVLSLLLWWRGLALAGSEPGWWRSSTGAALARICRAGFPLALGMAYLAAFVLLFQRASWRRWLVLLAAPGRMALTLYLLQTVFGIALFYGVGLGLGPRPGLAGILAIGLLTFGLQTMLSHWWLRRYRQGPMEWIWRALTWGRRPPFRRQNDDSPAHH